MKKATRPITARPIAKGAKFCSVVDLNLKAGFHSSITIMTRIATAVAMIALRFSDPGNTQVIMAKARINKINQGNCKYIPRTRTARIGGTMATAKVNQSPWISLPAADQDKAA